MSFTYASLFMPHNLALRPNAIFTFWKVDKVVFAHGNTRKVSLLHEGWINSLTGFDLFFLNTSKTSNLERLSVRPLSILYFYETLWTIFDDTFMRNVTSYVVQFWTVLTLIVLATFKSDTVGVTVPLSTLWRCQPVGSIAAGSTKLLAFNPSTHYY